MPRRNDRGRYPVPPSGKLSGGEPGMVRTLDGHVGVNLETDPDFAADIALRRNERVGSELDLGGHYDADAQLDDMEDS